MIKVRLLSTFCVSGPAQPTIWSTYSLQIGVILLQYAPILLSAKSGEIYTCYFLRGTQASGLSLVNLPHVSEMPFVKGLVYILI